MPVRREPVGAFFCREVGEGGYPREESMCAGLVGSSDVSRSKGGRIEGDFSSPWKRVRIDGMARCQTTDNRKENRPREILLTPSPVLQEEKWRKGKIH